EAKAEAKQEQKQEQKHKKDIIITLSRSFRVLPPISSHQVCCHLCPSAQRCLPVSSPSIPHSLRPCYSSLGSFPLRLLPPHHPPHSFRTLPVFLPQLLCPTISGLPSPPHLPFLL